MYFLPFTLLFIFGCIIGSFLNVVIYRLNSGFGIGGRSHCFSCGKTLRWYELVPLLSFVFLRGRCSICGSKISWQYPIVETATGLTFALLFAKGVVMFHENITVMSIVWFMLCAVIFSTLIVIAVYDLRHKIIPDSLAFLFGVCSLLYLFLRSPLLLFYSHGVNIFSWAVAVPILIDISVGVGFFLFFFSFWFFSKGVWMGLGDAKLAVGMGWFLGWSMGTASLMLAFWIGAIIGLVVIMVGKLLDKLLVNNQLSWLNSLLRGVTIKSEVPFAPFLVFSFFLVFFCDISLLTLQSFIATIFHL